MAKLHVPDYVILRGRGLLFRSNRKGAIFFWGLFFSWFPLVWLVLVIWAIVSRPTVQYVPVVYVDRVEPRFS